MRDFFQILFRGGKNGLKKRKENRECKTGTGKAHYQNLLGKVYCLDFAWKVGKQKKLFANLMRIGLLLEGGKGTGDEEKNTKIWEEIKVRIFVGKTIKDRLN